MVFSNGVDIDFVWVHLFLAFCCSVSLESVSTACEKKSVLTPFHLKLDSFSALVRSAETSSAVTCNIFSSRFVPVLSHFDLVLIFF
jgi:hypothetical protein